MSLAWIARATEKPELIFLPCCGMAALTVSQLLRLITLRVGAVLGRKTSIKYYRLYNTTDGEPEHVAKVSQHVENLFESPPLFYIAVIILYLCRGVTPAAAGTAWAYLACRVAHMLVHTGYNNVNHRALTFGSSILSLSALWVMVASRVLEVASA